jgi:uncharacterized caspase-like protein
MQKIYPLLIMTLFISACNPPKDDYPIGQNNHIKYDGNPKSPKRALVIGNSQYTHQALNNSTNDAIKMTKTLVDMGFYVTRAIDLNQHKMKGIINNFHETVRKIPQSADQKVALFYFSGHGARSNRDENYIIPTNNERIRTERDLRRQAFNIRTEIKDKMEKVNSDGVNIIIADACRDNPYQGSGKSLKRGLKRMETSSKGGGAVMAFAADEGETADDGDGTNGLYTTYLLKKMRENKNKPIDQVFMEVYDPVVKESQNQQHPWYVSTLEDEYCLDGCI